MTSIKTRTELSPDGHGYIAIVTKDGAEIYESNEVHPKDGIFADPTDAETHAAAWAKAHEGLEDFAAQTVDARMRLVGPNTRELYQEAHADDTLAAKMRKAAKNLSNDASARRTFAARLAMEADQPRVEIAWKTHSDPASVELVEVGGAWSEEFTPSTEDDERQLEIPGTAWTMSDDLASIVGRGSVTIKTEGGVVKISLGSEHVLTTPGELTLEQAEAPLRLVPAPFKPPAMGAVSEQVLRDRISYVESGATLLGLLRLERDRPKPRKRVLAMIEKAIEDHDDPRVLDDLTAIHEDRPPAVFVPDLAAAALMSAPVDAPARVLEQLVPECCDVAVLADLLQDEIDDGERSRDEVADALRARLAELGGDQEAAG